MKLPGLDDADIGLSGTLGSAAKYLWAAGLLAGRTRLYYDMHYFCLLIFIISWSKFNNDWNISRSICD
jgi:hypothetical protein